jgi:hypothetical protein
MAIPLPAYRGGDALKRRMLLIVGLTALACALRAQTTGSERFVGVWRGQMEILPAVTLNITDEGGGLSGAVLFYLIKRSSVMSEPTTSTAGIPEPLFNPKLEGQSLVFEVSHRRAHPPGTLSDPPVHFRLKLLDQDKAELVNESESSGSGVVLTRDH